MKSHSESGDAELPEARIMRRVLCGLMRSLLQKLDLSSCRMGKGLVTSRQELGDFSSPGAVLQSTYISVPYKVSVSIAGWLYWVFHGFCYCCRGPLSKGDRGKNNTVHYVCEWALAFVDPKAVWGSILFLLPGSAHTCQWLRKTPKRGPKGD